ncbi:MAG TPA: FAD-dependent monooxygenase [Pyrinomonadaceae bacterium]|nr:FAD-dependent monooxygenase [Pyrinomonadaceae bacterium]
MEKDVIIIGAGPTGLALACQFIRDGIDFVIVDKKEGTTPYSKAIGVQARTLEIYEQIGLADELVSLGSRAEKARMVEGGKVRGEIAFKDIGEGLSPYPFLLIVEQGKHEKLLYDFIQSHGEKIFWQNELTDFSQNENGVTVQIKNANGETQTINAKFLIGCDGAKSFVRHKLGLELVGGTFERLFYVADVEIDWEFSHEALHVCLAQNTVTAFFPMRGSDKNWRIVGTFPEGHKADEGEILYEEVERQIVADTELNLDITRVNWFSVYKVHSRAVNKFSEGRCFLAGDSAHIHTPAGAQGMNTGIQDGYNLAWKLSAVLRGFASEKLLDTYNDERLANAKHLLKTTDQFFNFGASDDWFVSFFRTHIFPYVAGFAFSLDIVKKAIFPLVSQIGINYRDSRLSETTGSFSVKAGDRMPYFLVDGESFYDNLREPRFHLIAFTDGRQSAFEMKTQALGKYADIIDVHSLPLYPHIAEIFGTKSAFTILLRPDNYIGLITNGNAPEAVQKYLSDVLG